jgi:hypothetical protein
VQDQSNPHGTFLRQLLSHQPIASAFFKAIIPESMQQSLDITTLEISKDQFIDSELEHQISDMLFRVYSNDLIPAYIYLLFQHKGNPEPLISYLLFRYMERIWEQTINQGLIGHLPLIIPVVIYNGSTPWNVSTQFSKLFGAKTDLNDVLPDFKYIMCDLSQIAELNFSNNTILSVGMHLLKIIHDNNFDDQLPHLLNPLKQCIENDYTRRFLSYVIEYICGSSKMSENDIETVIEEIFSKTGKDIYYHVHEQLFFQGVIHQAREGIVDVLTVRFETIPSKILETIQAIDEIEIMKILHKQAVTSSDIDEFEEVLEMMLF